MFTVSPYEQGSAEWLEQRAKYITGSIAHMLFTEPRLKKDKEAGNLSESAKLLQCTILAAYDGYIKEEIKTRRLEQSHIDEEEAAIDYEFIYDVELSNKNAFITSDKYKYAAISPDGMFINSVGEIEGLEIKCLDGDNHIKVTLQENGSGIDKKYLAQMEWYCFVLGVDKCNYYGRCSKLGKLGRYTWQYVMTEERRKEVESIYLKFEVKLDALMKEKGLI